MKKIVLSFVLATMVGGVALAQNVDVAGIKSKIAKSEADTQDPKKGAKAASWISLGDQYYQAANANAAALNVYANLSKALLVLTSKPDSESPVTIDGNKYTKLAYANMDVYLTDKDSVAFWIDNKPAIENALDKAVNAYKKALEVDPKSRSKVDKVLNNVAQAYRNEGNNYYIFTNYKKAAQLYAESAKVNDLSSNPTQDKTEIHYFAGVAAVQGEDYALAEEQLIPLAEAGYEKDGDIYRYLALSQDKLGKKAEAEANYIKGLEKFSTNAALLQSLIGFYIAHQDDPMKVIPLIQKGQAADPNNVVLYLAEGIAYESMKDFDKTVEAYKKAIAKKPDFFDALYNLGIAYYQKALDTNKSMSSIDLSNKKLMEDTRNRVFELFREATVPLQKAHEVNTKDINSVELLKAIYFSLRDQGPDMMAAYEKYNAIFKSMQ